MLSTIRPYLLAACLLWLIATPGGPTLAAVAVPGTLARISVEAGSRVNVRSDAAVRPDNVVGKVSSGDLVVIQEADDQGNYIWYRIEDEGGAFDGWVRGDLLSILEEAAREPQPAEPPPAVVPEPVEQAALEEAPSEEEAGPVPLDQRNDWSSYLLSHIAAISACANVSSAQPAVVLGAFPMSRGMIGVVVRDGRNRDWDCIVGESGGTPMRFDPLAGSSLSRTGGNQPVFTPIAGVEPVDTECTATEPVTDPGSGKDLGWLTYDRCE